MKIVRPLTHLTPKYSAFCAFESLAINGIGCGSLVFQDQLSAACPYPGLYEFWFSQHIPATSTEHLMCYMIASWLFVAGVLQGAINFDVHVPYRTKLIALYSFALCDMAWIFLMIYYTPLFSLYHIVGSAFTIRQRAKFWIPNREIAFIRKNELLD